MAASNRYLRGRTVGVLYNVHMRMARGLPGDAVSDADTLRTVAAAREALRAAGAHVTDLPCGSDARGVIRRLLDRRPDVVLNLCDCPRGDSALEPAVAAVLDLLGIPYTGADASALALCRQKPTVKRLIASAGIPTPPFAVVFPGRRLDRRVRLPAIVKPAHEDASCGIASASVVRTAAALARRVRFVHEWYGQEALVERYMDGRELAVSLVGNDPPRILPPGEIDFSRMPPGLPRIVGFDAKWRTNSPEYGGTAPIPARPLPRGVLAAIRRHAALAYVLTGCRDYGRVDFRLDRRLRPWVLEVNANPDLAPDAGLARAFERSGGTWADLLSGIVAAALARGRRGTRP